MPTSHHNPYKYLPLPILAGAIFIALVGYINAFSLPALEVGGNDEESPDTVAQLNQELKTRREEIEDLKKQAEEYRGKIITHRNEAFSLKNQLLILDAEIAKISVEIQVKQQAIEITKLDIAQIENRVAQLKAKIEKQKKRIAEILRIIYQNEGKSGLEILLLNDSLSDFFNQAQYIENLHDGLHKQLVELKAATAALESEHVSLEARQAALTRQKDSLEDQKYRLKQQEYAKTELLTETSQSEKTFRSLLQELKDQEAEVEEEIVNLEKTIRKKLEDEEAAKKLEQTKGEFLSWPVPKNTITAYFRDPSYPYRYIFEHPAIDIRARQGTTVTASASGYVAKTRKDPGCAGRYSYIMLIHANGISTVYGHVNSIDVEEGQFVAQGQLIGRSGATPGTCGAGRLTTGPHLHFEVRLNGIPVDPLGYLP
ncbi:MAG: peptidoglycan DD-metalloendopeptidase family protein [Candidatus Jacksonbacteria bacterium]|nr:peptidoglycan DD-metalloendopeptidase family protein [Candidatus Jacksonbacteria bacterium]